MNIVSRLSYLAAIAIIIMSLQGCIASNSSHTQTSKGATMPPSAHAPQTYVKLTTPEWAKDAVIYQINTRQFTEAGTFAAAQKKLPQLKALNVDILWLMPIHPIGVEKRKGSLGSPYSVKDYYGVNPEFGTEQDLKNFINAAHAQGFKVILDWVANHTAWDNALRFDHPDWYDKDYKGDFRPTPWWDWSDIIDLDYSHQAVREYMSGALQYWVAEYNIDGYRADVAGFVPTDFWEQVRRELDAIKPVFMLAEWESRDLHAGAFDMTYAWSWHEAIKHVVANEGDLHKLFVYYSWNESAFPKPAYRMTYIANHDSNAWEGTAMDTFGEGIYPAIMLSIVGEGMPLIYNGLEAGYNKALEFFEKDPIKWQTHPIGDLYKQGFAILKANTALYHGVHGARMIRVHNSNDNKIFSFVRQNDNNKVFAVFNFSSSHQSVVYQEPIAFDHYTDAMSNEQVSIVENTEYEIEPWGFRVFVK